MPRQPPATSNRHRHASAWLVPGAALAGIVLADPAPPVAAHVDGVPIPTRSVDALTPALVRDVHERLAVVTRETVQQLAEGAPDTGVVRNTGERVFESAHEHAQPVPDRPHSTRASGHPPRVELRLPRADELEGPLPADRVLALADGRAIHAGALEHAAALRLYRLRGELHLERMRRLRTLIDRELLRAHARRSGVSLHELEASLTGGVEVSEAQLREFLRKARAAGGSPDPARARPYLEFLARHERRASLLRALRADADIRINLRAPRRPLLPVETEGGLALSPAESASSGESVLVAYTNYRCRLCRATHRELDRLGASAHPPRIVLRDFVPSHDMAAVESAALVRCAARTGGLTAARRALLASEKPPQPEAIAPLARTTPAALRACMSSPEIRARIERDTRAALRLGFDQPPAFVVGGVPLSGMQSAERLRRALESPRP